MLNKKVIKEKNFACLTKKTQLELLKEIIEFHKYIFYRIKYFLSKEQL